MDDRSETWVRGGEVEAILDIFIQGAMNQIGGAAAQEQGYPYSPLPAIENWIRKRKFLEKNGFNFLFVEFAPFIDEWQGRENLFQEVLICDQAHFAAQRLQQIPEDYAQALKVVQAKYLGQFVHPQFTGQCHPTGWGSMYTSTIGSSTVPKLSANNFLVDSWLKQVGNSYFRGSIAPKLVSQREELHIEKLRKPLGELGLETEVQYTIDRIIRDHKLSSREISARIYQEDYESILTLHHRIIRRIFGLDFGASERKYNTVFVASPLRITFANSDPHSSPAKVPTSYRGGVWIFAGLEQDYDQARRSELLELLKLSLLTGISSAEASASESLSKGLRRHALRTAAAAIMGRNMSHNIGSHVLARYSSKIGAKRGYDSQGEDISKNKEKNKEEYLSEFLTYLQRRMDFLAEVATTDQAFWSESLLLKEQINRLNYSAQEKRFHPNKPILLSYITGKETHTASVEWGAPRDEDENGTEKADQYAPHDYRIACPSGEVGIHALFVILENIIRNSARHNSSADTQDGQIKIYVNVDDTGGNRSSDLLRIEIIDPRTKLNGRGYLSTTHDEALHDKINKILRSSLISFDGTTNPHYWGIREIQICAHYLRGFSFNSLDEQGTISPSVLEAAVHPLGPESWCLKYVMYLQRAKLMAIIAKSMPTSEELNLIYDSSELRRKGIHIVHLENISSPNWIETSKSIGGYEFLVVEDGIRLPVQGTAERASLPIRTIDKFTMAKIKTLIECGLVSNDIVWMEELQRIWAETYKNKRAAWEGRKLWGVAIQADSLKNLSLRMASPGQGDGGSLFAVTKSTVGEIVPLPDSLVDWEKTLETESIAAAWLDHGDKDCFELGGTGFGQAATKPIDRNRLWISAELALSDSAHFAYLEGCIRPCGWEILAAAVARVAVLDERVQSELDKTVLRGGLRLDKALPCAGIWVPSKSAYGELGSCDLENPNFEDCRKFLLAPRPQRNDQYPIDVLVIHLTILEALNKNRPKEPLQATMMELIKNTQAKDAEIIIVSGRGVAGLNIDSARYLPISALLESLVTRPSKLALMRAIWSAARPRQLTNYETTEQ